MPTQARKEPRAELRWLLLIHQIPADPAYLRVKVGRRLARVGAIALKNSVYVLPATDPCREDFTWTRREVVDGGGEAMLFEATAVEGMTTAQIERLFRDARAKDYAEIESTLVALGDKKTHERDSTLAELAKLEEQLREVERIDYFSSGAAEGLRGRLGALRARLGQRMSASSAPAQQTALRAADFQGRVWVTRAGVKVDRLACAWLIRRFLDRDAKLRFVDLSSYVPKRGELRFDMPEAEFTHVGDQCSFEVLCARFGFGAPGLARIAEIVHDLDIKDGRYLHPETEGVRALVDGMVVQHARDEARIEAASVLFEALLAGHGTAAPKRKR
jgi:hypothetical protein